MAGLVYIHPPDVVINSIAGAGDPLIQDKRLNFVCIASHIICTIQQCSSYHMYCINVCCLPVE